MKSYWRVIIEKAILLLVIGIIVAFVLACGYVGLKRAEKYSIEPATENTGNVGVTTAVASFYAHAYHGKLMANGQPYDMHKLTFAHKTLPFGTRVLFHYNGKEVIGTLTDRGPYIAGRMFDLSLAMAESLGLTERGVDAIRFTIIE